MILFLKRTFFVLSAFVSTVLTAQDFEKVTLAELQQKRHPADTSAAAAVLAERGSVTFDYSQTEGFLVNMDVRVRIKIYKKEGYEYANQTMPYYIDGNTQEKVKIVEAATYNLVDGKIVKTKMKSDGEFDEKVNRFRGVKKITLPNVSEGSVIEYRYTMISPFLGSLPDWWFQTSIPTDFSEFSVATPEYYMYSPNMRGYEKLEVKNERLNGSITINSKERYDRGDGSRGSTASFSSDKINFAVNKTTYTGRNLPAMEDEAYVNNIRNYITMVAHELASIRMPNQPFRDLSTDWTKVVKTIYDYDNFGPELNKTGYYEADVDAILKNAATPAEKIGAIFTHVKNTVKWNDYYGYTCNDGVRKAYKDRTGNVAEINLMLTSMLRYAGLEAHPVLLSTRSNGISFFPNRNAFNYVIAAVEVNGERILLDATEPFSLPNVLPTRDLNWVGRLIRRDGSYEEIDLMPTKPAVENINMTYKVNATGDVEGKVRRQYGEHRALNYRANVVGKAEEKLLEDLENRNGQIEISDYKRENDRELGAPLIETFSFNKTAAADVIGDKLYLHPLLFLAEARNPFRQEKRQYPVDFGYPMNYRYVVMLEIPEGYVVESLPQSANMSTGDGIGAFKFISAANGKGIQVSFNATLGHAVVPADYYEVLKEFFQKMVDKQNEKIVLKKA